MLSADLAKAIESEVARVDEKISTLRQSLDEMESYRERLAAFSEGNVEETSVPSHSDEAMKPPPERANDSKPSGRGPRSVAAKDEQAVLEALTTLGPRAEGGAIRDACGLTANRFTYIVKRLKADGRIKVDGVRRGARYSLPEGGPENPEPAPSATVTHLPPRRSAAVAPAGQRSKQAQAGVEKQESVKRALDEAGPHGATVEAIATKLGRSASSVRATLIGLARRGIAVRDLASDEEGDPIWRFAKYGAVPADEDGARTEPERRIVRSLKASPVPLTTRDIAANSGVRGDIGAMLGALSRRGVVTCIPGVGENGRTRWAMESAAEARVAA
jgi:hypothetical protein